MEPTAFALDFIEQERTDRRYASVPVEVIVGSLNPMLRGWGELLPAR